MSLVTENRTIQGLFSQRYSIDFYQREYKWGQGPVTTLIDDIFFKFDQHYREDLDVTTDTVSRFGWYYLNTIVTHKVSGQLYIVDGQQRLTTLTLILIALHHLARELDIGEDRVELLRDRIYGTSLDGKAFWMGAHGRWEMLDKLLRSGVEAELTGGDAKRVTLRHMHRNFDLIYRELRQRLQSRHRLRAFLLYYLSRIELV